MTMMVEVLRSVGRSVGRLSIFAVFRLMMMMVSAAQRIVLVVWFCNLREREQAVNYLAKAVIACLESGYEEGHWAMGNGHWN